MGSRPTSDTSSRRELYHEADVVVVGAGIFGCAAAYALAEQGRSVILLERWMQEPDRIVGELLQPGGYEALKKLGLGHCVDGIDAIPCYGYNVIYRTNPVSIPYPTRGDDGELTHMWNGHGVVGKRDVGRSFHHGRFIGQLRKACLTHKNISVFETEVVKTIRGEHTDQILGVETRTKSSKSDSNEKVSDYFFGQLTIIADGYNSTFRKQVTPSKPLFRSKFYALELIDTKLPQPGFGHVVIGDVAPILLYQIGTHETRALFDVPTGIPEASPANGGVRGYIKNHAIPALPESVRPAALKALEDGKIPRSMPNSWLPASKQTPRGMVLLGDANNMRHPLTGAGMTVAFNDVLVLTELLSTIPNLGDPQAIQEAMHTLYWRRKNYTSILNVLAQALYALFAANDRIMRVLQLGCFGYFEKGITDGPCGLLGGIIQRPIVLAFHFFSVAFLGIWMHSVELICSGPGPLGILKAPLVLVDAILILTRAAVVFLPLVWREGFV